MKNHLMNNSLCWLGSGCKHQYQKQFFSYFLSVNLSGSFSQSSGSLKLLKRTLCSISAHPVVRPCRNAHRCFSTSSSNESYAQSFRMAFPDQPKEEKRRILHKFALQIVDMVVMSDGHELEPTLGMLLTTKLSICTITKVFEILNSQKRSGLRFFEWIWDSNHEMRRSALLCSLIIDNLGRLNDYETMSLWLKEFTSEKICLTYLAFRFLGLLASTDSLQREKTEIVVALLNNVGGSSRNSGVLALIEMFCSLESFEMARHVISITESKESYYCLMVREKCRRGLIEDARGILEEMKMADCAINSKVYNYLLSSMWKNNRWNEASSVFNEMNAVCLHPDPITYEIVIISACNSGKMDVLHQVLNEMKSRGLEPRPQTLSCIIKMLFVAQDCEAAHRFVVDSSVFYKTSSSLMYSLMAKLYFEKHDIMSARDILVEMMEKGLKPYFSIYGKVVKEFGRSGRKANAMELENMYSKFVPNPV